MTPKLLSIWSIVSTNQHHDAGGHANGLSADFYHLDYLRKSLSRRSSRRSSRQSPPASPQFPRRQAPKKLNFALIEDPLLALASAASAQGPPTPPADQISHHDAPHASAKLPDSPMADQFYDDIFDDLDAEPEFADEKPHLLTHAKVYAIAEK
jgi:hypothetical protein